MNGTRDAGSGHRLGEVSSRVRAAILAAPALPAAQADVGGELVRVVLSLAGVIAVIFAAGWLSRRLQARNVAGGRRIRCVETLAVGTRDRLLLIDADGKRLLVGLGQGGLRTLHVYEGAAPVVAEPQPAPEIPNVAQLLARWKRS